MSVYTLAETLHKTVYEIEQMSYEEFNGWVAYLNMRRQNGR